MNKNQPAIGHVSNAKVPDNIREAIEQANESMKRVYASISPITAKLFGEVGKDNKVHTPQNKE